jgi:hypothetical protein
MHEWWQRQVWQWQVSDCILQASEPAKHVQCAQYSRKEERGEMPYYLTIWPDWGALSPFLSQSMVGDCGSHHPLRKKTTHTRSFSRPCLVLSFGILHNRNLSTPLRRSVEVEDLGYLPLILGGLMYQWSACRIWYVMYWYCGGMYSMCTYEFWHHTPSAISWCWVHVPWCSLMGARIAILLGWTPLDGSQTAAEPEGKTTTVLFFGQYNHPSNL